MFSSCFCFSGLSLHLSCPGLGVTASASALPRSPSALPRPRPRGGCLGPGLASPCSRLSLPRPSLDLGNSASAPAYALKKCLDCITGLFIGCIITSAQVHVTLCHHYVRRVRRPVAAGRRGRHLATAGVSFSVALPASNSTSSPESASARGISPHSRPRRSASCPATPTPRSISVCSRHLFVGRSPTQKNLKSFHRVL